jgi:hypothetical protein
MLLKAMIEKRSPLTAAGGTILGLRALALLLP